MIFAVPGMRVRPCSCCNGGTVNVPPPSGGMSWVRGNGVGSTEPDEPRAA